MKITDDSTPPKTKGELVVNLWNTWSAQLSLFDNYSSTSYTHLESQLHIPA